MTTETSKEQRNPRKRRVADSFVMMAMAVVALALCMGLVAQVGLSFWLAVTVSAAFYMGLLTLHVLVRRHDQLDELRTDLDRLSGEVARLNQQGGPVGRVSQPAMPAGASARAVQGGMSAVPVPSSSSIPVDAPPMPPYAAPNADPLARVAAAMPRGMKAAASETDRTKGAAPSGVPEPVSGPLTAKGIDDLGDALAASGGALNREHRDPAAPQMQKIVRAPATLAPNPHPGDARGLELELPMGSPPAPALQPSMRGPAPPAGNINNTYRNTAAMPPVAMPPFGASSTDLPPPPKRAETSGYGFDDRPPHSASTGQIGGPEPTPVDPLAAQMSGASTKITGPHLASGNTTPISTGEPGPADAWSYRPGDDARHPNFSPSESDVEMIQGLIKKLADEVNSVDAQKLPLGPSRAAMDEQAVDRSVGALRQAARNMHEPVVNARGSRAARRVNESEAGAGAAREGHTRVDQEGTGAAPKPMPAPSATNPAPVVPDVSTVSEFDVDALMRRAQPIATMTSMPPPLPAAPNAMDKGALPQQSGVKAPPAETAQTHSAEDSADELWSAMGADQPTAAEQPPHDEIDERVARIADALEAGRVEVFLEPILDLEKQQARHYEVSLCLRDESGDEISPDDQAETERPSGILPLLDSVRLQRTAHLARRLEERNKHGHVFSTFSGQSLTADDFLSTFAETYDTQVQLAGQLVLTFSQDDARRFRTPHWTMINEMRDLGFGFALRAVTDLDMDFETLVKSGFKFAKLDAEVFLSGLPAPGATVPAADLCKHLEDLGLMPVVEAINDDSTREQVFSYGARLGQGRLFGGARQIKTPAGSGSHTAAA